MQRIDRTLVDMGVGSRKEVQRLISSGAVSVDGQCIREAQHKVAGEGSVFTVAGQQMVYRRHDWVMLNKPAGYLSTTTGAFSVLELLQNADRRPGLFPVGRLDKDSEGLLLISNDGQLAHRLLAPKRQVVKRYYVIYQDSLAADAAAAFQRGIVLENGEVCLPASLTVVENEVPKQAMVTICEGKFHQVKRMIAAVGGKVVYLRRIAFGPLSLDISLAPGAYRRLTAIEIAALKEAAGEIP
jgi:16S rRNA pseudouridine516 synthase